MFIDHSREPELDWYASAPSKDMACETCNGRGKVMYQVTKDESDLEVCEDCNGAGYKEFPEYDPDLEVDK